MADAQVAAWLRQAGLSRFIPRFAAALVSGPLFLQLSAADLDALGLDSPADRKRLSDLILDLRRAHPPTPHPPRATTHLLPTVRRSLDASNTAAAAASPSCSSSPSSSSSSSSSSPSDPAATVTATAAAAANATATARVLPRATSLSVDPAPTATTRTATTTTTTAARMARVTVCVRKRPLSSKEVAAGDRDHVTVQAREAALCVHEVREKVDLTRYVDTHPFAFDRVFAESATNAAVYDGTARPLVDALFAGGRGTCFAYGQTGAGKTFTMAGDAAENPGLYTLAVRDVFDKLREEERALWMRAEAEGNDEFEPPEPAQVWISFYEIYAAKLQDLLNRSAKLECREDSNNEVQIVGLTERLCEVEEDVLAYIDAAGAARSTGTTGANDDSSRSHAVFQIQLRHPPSPEPVNDAAAKTKSTLLRTTRSKTAAAAAAANGSKRGAEIGRLCFIDLAGSERGSDTATSTKQTRREGSEINKSLLALKECIRAMDQKKDHTPFRGSKLTQVLKASFTGKNCSTVMIANISPASSNVEHTLNTLRYSDRVKEIKRTRSGGGSSGGSGSGGRPAEAEFVSKPIGNRRATFSHGIGIRSGRPSVPGTPLRSTQQRITSSDNDWKVDSAAKKVAELAATERKPSKPHPRTRKSERPPDVLASSTGLPHHAASRPAGKKAFPRTKSRDLNKAPSTKLPLPQGERGAATKAREPRVTRRRTTRAPSMIPSRPSMGGSLRRKESQASRTPRAATMTGRGRGITSPTHSSENTSSTETPTSSASMHDSCASDSSAEKPSAPPAPLRKQHVSAHPSRPTISSAREPKDHALDSSRPPQAPSLSADPFDTESDKEAVRKGRKAPRKDTSNKAAVLAMKQPTPSRQDELFEEDLLFASTDNLADAATVVAHERQRAVSEKADEERKVGVGAVSRKMTVESSTQTHVVAPERRPVAVDTSPPSSLEEHPERRSGKAQGRDAAPKKKSDALRKVIRLHHMQIEELMRLTESDVVLVNAAEKGEIDADEYGLKLQLNLSQKLDIVKTLQSQLPLLE